MELIDHKNNAQQNLGFHFVEKYTLYDHIDVSSIVKKQSELGNVDPVVRLLGKNSKIEKEKRV